MLCRTNKGKGRDALSKTEKTGRVWLGPARCMVPVGRLSDGLGVGGCVSPGCKGRSGSGDTHLGDTWTEVFKSETG